MPRPASPRRAPGTVPTPAVILYRVLVREAGVPRRTTSRVAVGSERHLDDRRARRDRVAALVAPRPKPRPPVGDDLEVLTHRDVLAVDVDAIGAARARIDIDGHTHPGAHAFRIV